jgi:hypothetical protein
MPPSPAVTLANEHWKLWLHLPGTSIMYTVDWRFWPGMAIAIRPSRSNTNHHQLLSCSDIHITTKVTQLGRSGISPPCWVFVKYDVFLVLIQWRWWVSQNIIGIQHAEYLKKTLVATCICGLATVSVHTMNIKGYMELSSDFKLSMNTKMSLFINYPKSHWTCPEGDRPDLLIITITPPPTHTHTHTRAHTHAHTRTPTQFWWH